MRDLLLMAATWFSGWRANVWTAREAFFAGKLSALVARRKNSPPSPGRHDGWGAVEGAWAPQSQLPGSVPTAGGARPPCAFSGEGR